jgi:alpha-tubulin suppressor-like RCC1 family protein
MKFKNKIFTCFAATLCSITLMAQVGVGGTDTPRGLLDINPKTGTAIRGWVLPKVESADTINYAPEGQAARIYPNVTTPDGAFLDITVNVPATEDEAAYTAYYHVPTVEVPGGTIVYDESIDGLRIKRSQKLGDWSGAIVDATMITDSINYRLLGGADFKMKVASAGYYWSVGIGASDNAVYSCGGNDYYRTGKNRSSGYSSWSLILGQPAKDVSAGYVHGLALLENGDVYSWGSNNYGRTGQGTRAGNTMRPTKVNLPGNVKGKKVIAGYYNSMVLGEDGNVYMCGSNSNGWNGNGTTSGYQLTFTKVNITGNPVIKNIAHSGKSSLALAEGDSIFVWGSNVYTSIGLPGTSNITTPTKLTMPLSANSIGLVAVSTSGGIAVSTDGTKLFYWGANNALFGTTAGNFPASVTPREPVALPFETGEVITNLATQRYRYDGYYGASVLIGTNFGRVYAAGYNSGSNNGGPTYNNSGKLGIVNLANGSRPTIVNGLTLIQDHGIYSGTVITGLSIGLCHSFITTDVNLQYKNIANYTAYGSGYNYHNCMGNGPRATRVFGTVKK